MSILNPELLNLTSTAVVSVVALWVIVQLFKEKKKNGNGKREYWEIMEKINAFEKNLDTNHFDSLDNSLNRLEGKVDQMTSILIEIRTILKNKK